MPFGFCEGETECGSLAETVGLRTDFSAVRLDDTPHRCQPDSQTGRVRIEFFKQAEELLLVTRIDPLAVVADEQDDLAAFRLRPDLDPGSRLVAHEFHGIVHQVLKDPHQAGTIPVKPHPLSGGFNLNTTLRNLAGHKIQRFPHNLLQRHLYGRLLPVPDMGEFQNFVQQARHFIRRAVDHPQILGSRLDFPGFEIFIQVTEERPDRHQRAFEIVRDRVGEVRDLGVLPEELFLSPRALGDVAERPHTTNADSPP